MKKKTNNHKNLQYPLRCSERWMDAMKRKASRKSKIRGTPVTVADLIREACKDKYGVSEGG